MPKPTLTALLPLLEQLEPHTVHAAVETSAEIENGRAADSLIGGSLIASLLSLAVSTKRLADATEATARHQETMTKLIVERETRNAELRDKIAKAGPGPIDGVHYPKPRPIGEAANVAATRFPSGYPGEKGAEDKS